jgi:hypothetical protein
VSFFYRCSGKSSKKGVIPAGGNERQSGQKVSSARDNKPAIETLFWLEVILFEKEVLQIMR